MWCSWNDAMKMKKHCSKNKLKLENLWDKKKTWSFPVSVKEIWDFYSGVLVCGDFGFWGAVVTPLGAGRFWDTLSRDFWDTL